MAQHPFKNFSGLALLLFVAACQPDSKKAAEKNTTIPANKEDIVIDNLQQAIDQYPDSAKLYNILADTFAGRRQYSKAAAVYDKILQRGNDENYYYWFLKGDAFRRGQAYDSAIIAYRTYLAQFPDDEQVLLNLGNTYAEAGNKDAIDLANIIATRYPNREMRSEAAFIKGVYYNTVKEYANARKWLDTTIMLNYNFSEAYMEKGYSLYDEGKYRAALQTFTTLSNLNSGYADAWYWMAKSQEALGMTADAINNYETAYALDQSITEALTTIERLKNSPSLKPSIKK